jgi:hypothetical protein
LKRKNIKNFTSKNQKISIIIVLKITEYKFLRKNIQGSAMNMDDWVYGYARTKHFKTNG